MSKALNREIRKNITCIALSVMFAIGTFSVVANISPVEEPIVGYESTVF